MANIQLPVGLEIAKVDFLPEDHPDYPGQFAVGVKNASGEVAWGFGNTDETAATDAVASFNGDFGHTS